MITVDGRRRRAVGAILAGAFTVAHLTFWLLPDIFEPWHARTIDRLFTIRAQAERFRLPYDDRIGHVDLDDGAVRFLRTFYLNRTHFATVVKNLAACGVAAQVYDFIFAAPSTPQEDAALIDAVAAAGNVYLGAAFHLDRAADPERARQLTPDERHLLDAGQWHPSTGGRDDGPEGHSPLMTFPDLAARSKGLGFINITPDRDGVFRRVPLLIRTADGYFPSLPLRAVSDYLEVDPSKVVVDPGRSITLRGARSFSGGPPHDIVIPTDRHGNLILNFLGPWEAMAHTGFDVVWQASEDRDRMAILREQLAGRLVVVADSSTGSADVGPVPTDPQFPLAGIHATVLHGILTESFLREAPFPVMLLAEAVLLCALFVMAIRLRPWRLFVGTAAIAVLYVGIWAWSFLSMGLILNAVRPVLMMGIAIAAVAAYRQILEERDKAALRRSFEAYFPPAVVERIVADPTAITHAGQKKELTILFSDIKEFTARSATMAPDDIRALLNDYFGAMVEIVFRHGGTVDKFIGDGLMVFFGDPVDQPDHAERCVRCAIDMQKTVRAMNARWAEQGQAPIQIRIGINSGFVVVGNMGSSRRLSYTALGAEVNLAQRLESSAPVGGILLSDATRQRLDGRVAMIPRPNLPIKGLIGQVSAYEVSPEEYGGEAPTADRAD